MSIELKKKNKTKKIKIIKIKKIPKPKLSELLDLVKKIYFYEPELYYKIKDLVLDKNIHIPYKKDISLFENTYKDWDYWGCYEKIKTPIEINNTICPLCLLPTTIKIEEYTYDDRMALRDMDYYNLDTKIFSKCIYCSWNLKFRIFECCHDFYIDDEEIDDNEPIYKNKNLYIDTIQEFFGTKINLEKVLWDIYIIIWQIIRKKYNLWRILKNKTNNIHSMLKDLAVQEKRPYIENEIRMFSFNIMENGFWNSNNRDFINITFKIFSNKYIIHNYKIPELEKILGYEPTEPKKIKIEEQNIKTGIKIFEDIIIE